MFGNYSTEGWFIIIKPYIRRCDNILARQLTHLYVEAMLCMALSATLSRLLYFKIEFTLLKKLWRFREEAEIRLQLSSWFIFSGFQHGFHIFWAYRLKSNINQQLLWKAPIIFHVTLDSQLITFFISSFLFLKTMRMLLPHFNALIFFLVLKPLRQWVVRGLKKLKQMVISWKGTSHIL